MKKAIFVLLFFMTIMSCQTHNFYVDKSVDQKIGLINIDTVFQTITNDSIKLKIGFKDIPKDSILVKFLRVEMIFDVKNDTSLNNDLGIGFIAFLPDSSGTRPPLKTTIVDIMREGSIRALFKYTSPIDNGFCYIIKDMNFQGNYLVINVSKKSHKLFNLITSDLKWHVIATYADGLNHENPKMYSDYFSPFYLEEIRYKNK